MVTLVTSNYRLAFILISGVVLILWLATSVLMPDFYDNMTTLRQNEPMGMDRPLPYFPQENIENDVIDSCLRNKDPWNEEILKYVNPSEKKKFDKTCKPMTQITQLIESSDEKLMRLSIRPEYEREYACQYRCLYPKDDYNYREGFWISFQDPTQPPCDVFEVECKKKNDGSKKADEDLFRDVYYQIYRPPVNATKEAKGFGVLIFVIDSTSHSNFLRGLQKFTHLLREEYEAIPFPHLNKVGLNSLPNGFAFLMGKQAEDMPKSPINKKKIKADIGYDFDSKCHKPLDNETSFILSQFRNLGYKTMWAEDWGVGTFNWPDCTGFKDVPVDHLFKPFIQRIDFMTLDDLRKTNRFKNNPYTNYMQDHCREIHEPILKYLESFHNFYDDIEQRLSLTWMVTLTHDHLNGLYHADTSFYNTFKRLKPKLENSFLFVMSDHGIRFGPHRKTETGAIEDNNPALFIALPKELRKNTHLKNIMQENARHLISQHDVYATLLSIAKDGHEWNSSTWDHEWPKVDQVETLPNMHGSSLFHYPMKQPRDCPTLRIPFDYCQCPGKYIKMTDPVLNLRLAKESTEKLNGDIQKRGYSDRCEELSVDESAQITLLELKIAKKSEKNNTNSPRNFKIMFQTVPGGGQFSVKLRMLQSGKVDFTSEQFERLNKHGDQSQCARNNPIVMPLCYCKKLDIDPVSLNVSNITLGIT